MEADAAARGIPLAETEPERWPFLEASYRAELARVRAQEAKSKVSRWKELVRTDAGAFAWLKRIGPPLFAARNKDTGEEAFGRAAAVNLLRG
eukprot:11710063-Alexandrium_andersonii.AAC.1